MSKHCFKFLYFAASISKKSMKKLKIAIDGWSSCGKSTLAKQIAKHLGYTYIDSGAMYRAITLFFMRNNIDLTDASTIENAISQISLRFIPSADAQTSEIYLNDENVEMQIRSMAVADEVSKVAALKQVRDFAVSQQQEMGKHGGVVMDGRDIGTVVFPDAEVKLFMTASPEIRTKRRYLEMAEKGIEITMEEVMENLKKRDHIDSTRTFSPLIQATDALVIDNSNLTMEEQLDVAMKLIQVKINLAQD
ncbi:MAG: hypothetical protein RIR96_1236 [Bacteroidota bacterium]